MDNPATILSLFTGIGGLDHGIRLAVPEARVVCGVERELAACQVLAARMEDGSIEPYPVWSDVTTFDGTPWRGAVDLICGGFPCQDISCAGKGAGLEGARSGLWYEYARIIREVEPRYVFVENVGALLVRGLDAVLGTLAELGFSAEWGTLRASDVGAPHRRERVFILAYSRERGGQGDGDDSPGGELGADGAGVEAHEGRRMGDPGSGRHGDAEGEVRAGRDGSLDAGDIPEWPPGPSDTAGWEHVLDRWPWLAPALEVSPSIRRERSQRAEQQTGDGRVEPCAVGAGRGDDEEAPQPADGLLADGLPLDMVVGRIDALRALGNAVVPAQAAAAFRILWERMR